MRTPMTAHCLRKAMNDPIECPRCGEIELRLNGEEYECDNCPYFEQLNNVWLQQIDDEERQYGNTG